MHLFAAVPTHSGTLAAETVQTLLSVQRIALGRGWTFSFKYLGGATISVTRNALVGDFLETGADLMLMLDADQGAEGATLERMIDFDKPVVGSIYPKRSYNWANVNLATITNVDEIFYQAAEFVGWLDADAQGQVSVENGFARATHVGTGLLLVKREAFQQLMNHFPELEGLGFAADGYRSHTNWGFFNPLFRKDGIALSEDLSFCQRWRQAGGEIWAEVASNIIHVGRFAFEGNYLDYLKAQSD